MDLSDNLAPFERGRGTSLHETAAQLTQQRCMCWLLNIGWQKDLQWKLFLVIVMDQAE